MLRRVLLFCCISSAVLTDPPCVIELECAECLPDNMPLVASHRASNGTVTAEAGDELVLECRGGKFLAYPLLATLSAVCEAGRYRVARDGTLRHLLELGCQENIFEDVLHEVEYCSPPLQGRAYQLQTAHGAHHLATLCFDQDRGVATRALTTNSPANALPLPQHRDHASTRSLLGNFNQMFDSSTRNAAEKLYSDDVSTNHRLREILKHDRFTFADQTLTSAELLSTHYFDDQYMRVAKFVSNKVAVWRSIATGNLHHLHRDVAKFMKMSRPHTVVNVYAGTHDVLSLRTGHTKTKIFLKPERFPVPKYIWTVVHDKKQEKALAIVVLNDPFVSVSEIRETVFCESACGSVSWLHELRRHRHYESPVYGLVFCCNVHNFTRLVTEMPEDIVKNVPLGNAGVLADLYT